MDHVFPRHYFHCGSFFFFCSSTEVSSSCLYAGAGVFSGVDQYHPAGDGHVKVAGLSALGLSGRRCSIHEEQIHLQSVCAKHQNVLCFSPLYLWIHSLNV